MRERYTVTTIGEIADVVQRIGCECARGAAAADGSMTGLDDLTALWNPLAWLAKKAADKAVGQLTGKAQGADPGLVDKFAKELGVDPIEMVISAAGYSGWGRYWPAAKIAGGAVALGAAGLLVARALSSSSTARKRKKGR